MVFKLLFEMIIDFITFNFDILWKSNLTYPNIFYFKHSVFSAIRKLWFQVTRLILKLFSWIYDLNFIVCLFCRLSEAIR